MQKKVDCSGLATFFPEELPSHTSACFCLDEKPVVVVVAQRRASTFSRLLMLLRPPFTFGIFVV